MPKNKSTASKPGVPTQRYLDIAEIKEDIVIMKDGTLRAVLLVSSINFSLKSVDEQNAIVQAYMQFLNGLNFPIQVVIQSRHINIDDYLEKLKDAEKEQKNDLLRRQITDYVDYVKQLVELGEIMQKRFYVVLPLNPGAEQVQKGFFARIGEILTPSIAIRLSEGRFRKNKELLMMRVNQVASGLQSMSLNAVMLDTQSLIELYYTVYNPEIFEAQRMTDVEKLQLED
ncbi:conjugal transfer protein TraC [Patescibacteria group bacterium]|nr:conjugal transfer protein TraC [Patescibacteria group bacterium]MBU1907795.1 conjugal transfer protein TraC [Patescibacteria group bacterium]